MSPTRLTSAVSDVYMSWADALHVCAYVLVRLIRTYIVLLTIKIEHMSEDVSFFSDSAFYLYSCPFPFQLLYEFSDASSVFSPRV